MDQTTTDQIEAHIERTREDLGSNLQELEQKVKSVADWREHVRAHPMTMLGVAFGGGMMLSSIMSGHKSKSWERLRAAGASGIPLETAHLKRKTGKTWDIIRNALAGVAVARVQDYVGQIVPGFQDQYRRARERAEAADFAMR